MKQNKFLGVLAIALSLVLSACGNGGGKSTPAGGSSKCKHQWGEYVTVVEETCTEDGKAERTCSLCGEKQDKVIKAAHKWGEWDVTTAATCQAEGARERVCQRCGEKQEEVVPKADHDWDEWETVTAADCTNAGSRKHACKVCGTEETETVAALGHTWGDWVETLAPTCLEEGSRKHVCSVCGVEESEAVDALGHDLELVGGETEAPDGEATVRLYKCKRCNIEYLGFKADEPSADSLPHLTVGDNGGMRFWGRPIGNALALKSDGSSANEQNNECVYCSTETGDFFEYIFTLNAAQAETLSTCRLYCDARPANHLSGDFWAYSGSATDWTPGYYIDGSDAHIQKEQQKDDEGNPMTDESGNPIMVPMMVNDHARAPKTAEGEDPVAGEELETKVAMGARITDYRYVLYVDDEIKQFDPDTSVRVEGSSTNMVRKEYVLPYTFHLHEGQNKISLRMAGGYRSEFFNFIFRPYVEPTPVVVNESTLEIREGKTAQITSSMDGLTYKSSSTSVATVDENGVVTGVKAGNATITVSKAGNYKDAKVAVTVLEKEGIITLNLTDGVIAPAGDIEVYNSSSSGTWYRNFKKDATITYTFQCEKAGRYDVQLGLRGSNIVLADNFEITFNDGDPIALEGTVNTSYSAVESIVGQADLKVGENTMVIKALAENGMYLKTLKLVPHNHTWVEAEIPAGGENDAVVMKYTCACGQVKYEIAAKTAKMQVEASSDWKTDPTTSSDGAFKLNNGKTATFSFSLPKSFNGKMYQRCYMDSYNNNKTKKMFYQTGGHCNIEVKVNGSAIDFSQFATTTFQEVFGDELNGSNSLTMDVELGDVALATANSISYKRVETLNMLVTHFVFIGTEATA